MSRSIVEVPWLWLQWSHQYARGLMWQAIDGMLGVHTTPPQRPSPYVPIDSQIFESKPCGWLPLYRALHWTQPGPNDVFLDVGSGHGRAVILASLFPFKRVIGLEISEALYRAAQQNIVQFRVRRRAPIEFVLSDASVYNIPDEVSYVFMYNPFRGQVFRSFARQLFVSVDVTPRPVYLIYANPVEHDFLSDSGYCRLIKRFRGWRPTRDWARMLTIHIYKVQPAA